MMHAKHPDPQATAAYLEGNLDGRSKQVIEQHLTGCASCRAGIVELREALCGAETRVPEDLLRPARERVPSSFRPYFAAAATLAVAAVVGGVAFAPGWHAPGSSSLRAGADAWSSGSALVFDQDTVFLRVALGHGSDPVFAAALEAYRNGETARVVRLLRGKPIPARFDPLRLVFADALTAERHYEAALAQLDRSEILTLPQPARDRAKWILQLALEGMGDRAGAHDVLTDLASRPGEFRERARAALTAQAN